MNRHDFAKNNKIFPFNGITYRKRLESQKPLKISSCKSLWPEAINIDQEYK